jgi:hypothetical protein
VYITVAERWWSAVSLNCSAGGGGGAGAEFLTREAPGLRRWPGPGS